MTSRSADEIGAIAGAEIDEAHRDGLRVVGERVAHRLGADEAAVRLEPLHLDRPERLRGAGRGDRQARELRARHEQAAGEPVDRLHEPVGRGRLQRDLRGIRPQQGREQLARLTGMIAHEIDARWAPGPEQLGVGMHLRAHRRRERAECRPVQISRLAVEGPQKRLPIGHGHILACDSAPRCAGRRSAAESAIPRRVVADRAEEVDLAQIGSERLDEVELAVRALPEQEVAQALLPRGADHQVRVGLTAGVEVLADLLGREVRGELLERSALPAVLGDDAADRVDDLGAPAVADREIDVEPGLVPGALLGFRERPREREAAGDRPVRRAVTRQSRSWESASASSAMISMRSDSSLRVALAEIVGRQQVERDDPHADLVAPAEEVAHLRRTGAVTVRRGVVAELLGPAPVAVDHHRDVVRDGFPRESAAKAVDVEPVDGPSPLVRRGHTPTVPRPGTADRSRVPPAGILRDVCSCRGPQREIPDPARRGRGDAPASAARGCRGRCDRRPQALVARLDPRRDVPGRDRRGHRPRHASHRGRPRNGRAPSSR